MTKRNKPEEKRVKSEKRGAKRDAAQPALPDRIAPGTSEVLGEHDLYLFNEGTHHRLYEKLGSRVLTLDGISGVYFAVWAPDAQQVSVIGDFNEWNGEGHRLSAKGSSGIWEGFFPGLPKGVL